MTWESGVNPEEWRDPPQDPGEVFDCPFCGQTLYWPDAVRFGCTACTASFEEGPEYDEITFTPCEGDCTEEDD